MKNSITTALTLLLFFGFHFQTEAKGQIARPNRQAQIQERKALRDGLGGQQPNRKKVIERIKQLRIWKLTERLKLNEDQSVKFFPKYNRYQDDLAGNLEKLQTQFREMQELSIGSAADADLDRKVQQVLETQRGSSEILQKYTKEFRDVLSARQVAELIVFERDFLRDISGLLEAARKKEDGGDK
ncbi:MAG: hypothetical protein IAF08_03545 [Rhizobacter sp.]|nr:hypothetical protein [Chlorobiales bacterium]